jgi:Glycosyltransferase family 87
MSPTTADIPSPHQARLQRITTVVAVLVVLLFVGRIALTLITRASSSEADMVSYYDGTQRLRDGLPLYRPDISIQQQNFQFIYPPPLAFILMPFPSYQAAWWGWGIFSIICWLGSLSLILRELWPGIRRRLAPMWRPLLVAALINFPPVESHLFWGQTQLLLLLLLTGSWLCLRRRRAGLAGALLGLAIALKLFPALLIAPLLVQRRWRCIAVALATATGVFALSFALVGWDQGYYYLTKVLPEVDRSLSGVSNATTSIGAVLRGTTGNSDLSYWLSLVFRLAVLAAAALAAARVTGAPDQALAIGMTTLALAPPVVWEHYFVLLYLPWLELLARAPGRRLPLLALAYFLIATASLAYHMPPTIGFYAHLPPIGGALLLLGLQIDSVFGRLAPLVSAGPEELSTTPSTG